MKARTLTPASEAVLNGLSGRKLVSLSAPRGDPSTGWLLLGFDDGALALISVESCDWLIGNRAVEYLRPVVELVAAPPSVPCWPNGPLEQWMEVEALGRAVRGAYVAAAKPISESDEEGAITHTGVAVGLRSGASLQIRSEDAGLAPMALGVSLELAHT